MSDQPTIAQKQPYVMELEAGTYYWCSCGQSSKQPFCDGSHKGTSFTPIKTEIEETKKVALCGCKHSQKAPFCDGAHAKL
ncbi:CDGSH iron-sulfur domain-containing protein [Pontibacter sp. G13]|uniref:CDGSH iron-sulfur domain-containing protein n=1 Tax=Pontibacter sp. G13 TaxID=3074898 RepID=UPI0028899AAF|nr:CDGSH iron-sulfur domain-containing protein [Pontibacter sp. G13]WNJ18926.1 CDGSH iron-sulfur domain-containing protein [Pontibacter sp. G13]